MNEIQKLLAWYERGVYFECECRGDWLHPEVRHALLSGRLSTEILRRCPVHGSPVRGPAPPEWAIDGVNQPPSDR